MSYATKRFDQLATVRSILADVHARAGNLARSQDAPNLATTPDDEDRLVAHLRQACRQIAVETGRVYVTVEVEVSADTSIVTVPDVLDGARIAEATWAKDGEPPAPLAVESERFDSVHVKTTGLPTRLLAGPRALGLDPAPSVEGILAVSGVARSGFVLDGSGEELEEPLGLSTQGQVGGDAIHIAFPRELARCAAFLVLQEHFDERGALDLADRFERRAEAEIERYRPDTRQTGFARATRRPFG